MTPRALLPRVGLMMLQFLATNENGREPELILLERSAAASRLSRLVISALLPVIGDCTTGEEMRVSSI